MAQPLPKVAMGNDDLTIATTDTHLPQRIRHALHRAFNGAGGMAPIDNERRRHARNDA
jgi:hypothetical protein